MSANPSPTRILRNELAARLGVEPAHLDILSSEAVKSLCHRVTGDSHIGREYLAARLTDRETRTARERERRAARAADARSRRADEAAATEAAARREREAKAAARRGPAAAGEIVMIARYPGRCATCGAAFPDGTGIFYHTATRTARHARAQCPTPAPAPAPVSAPRPLSPSARRAPRREREYPDHECARCLARWETAGMDCVMSDEGEGPHVWVPRSEAALAAHRIPTERYGGAE